MFRIYDLNIDLLAEIDDYESLIFTRNYHEPGTFEIQISADKNNVEYLVKDNIIVVANDNKKCGIIKAIERATAEAQVLRIIGYTFDFLFKDRLVYPAVGLEFDTITAPIETVIKHYIDVNVINPLDADRKIDILNLIVSSGAGATKEYNGRYQDLNIFLSEIRTEQEIGIQCALNTTTKKIDVDILIGADHKEGTTNPVIFSTEYDNLADQMYFESTVETKTVAIIGGEGEGVARAIDEFGTATGINRKEIFVDTNLQAASLQGAGQTELAQYPDIITFEGRVINRAPFIYQTDFDLGDEVTVRDRKPGKWDVNLNTRIITTIEIFEKDAGARLEVVFGNKIPDMKTIINQRTKKEAK